MVEGRLHQALIPPAISNKAGHQQYRGGAISHGHQQQNNFQQHGPESTSTNPNSVSLPQILDEVRRGLEEQKKIKDEIRRMGTEVGRIREEYKKLYELVKTQADASFTIESSVYKVRGV